MPSTSSSSEWPLFKPALDLRAAVVAPERLLVDDEEGRAEHAGRDGRIVRRLQARLPLRIGPHRFGLVRVDAEFGRQLLQPARVAQVHAAREVGTQAMAGPV